MSYITEFEGCKIHVDHRGHFYTTIESEEEEFFKLADTTLEALKSKITKLKKTSFFPFEVILGQGMFAKLTSRIDDNDFRISLKSSSGRITSQHWHANHYSLKAYKNTEHNRNLLTQIQTLQKQVIEIEESINNLKGRFEEPLKDTQTVLKAQKEAQDQARGKTTQ